MAFVKYEDDTNKYKIGEWVITQKVHANFKGIMEAGTRVQIIGKNARGYSIRDEEGNQITECGWTI